jgi:hypothetical protein
VELVTFSIKRKQADHRPIVVAPIGDIQYAGTRGPTAKDLLRRHLDRCLEMDAWYVGLGDYIDFLSPSNRQRLKAAALYDTAEDVIDDKAIDLTLELYQEYLKPTKGRWLGMLHGHHFAQLKSGETTDQRLCQLLDTRFLGTAAFIRLQFQTSDTDRSNVTIWAHHGCGGGMKSAAPLNKLENIAPYWDADLFLIGHMTKMATSPVNRVSPRWNGKGGPDLVHRKIMLVGCGGFSKGYVEGSKQGRVPMGGYVEQKMLNPAALGAPIIRIKPTLLDRGDGPTRSRTWAPEITVEV